ncbi:hypothetical protein KIPB_011679, partial [Kipferlia bialata]
GRSAVASTDSRIDAVSDDLQEVRDTASRLDSSVASTQQAVEDLETRLNARTGKVALEAATTVTRAMEPVYERLDSVGTRVTENETALGKLTAHTASLPEVQAGVDSLKETSAMTLVRVGDLERGAQADAERDTQVAQEAEAEKGRLDSLINQFEALSTSVTGVENCLTALESTSEHNLATAVDAISASHAATFDSVVLEVQRVDSDVQGVAERVKGLETDRVTALEESLAALSLRVGGVAKALGVNEGDQGECAMRQDISTLSASVGVSTDNLATLSATCEARHSLFTEHVASASDRIANIGSTLDRLDQQARTHTQGLEDVAQEVGDLRELGAQGTAERTVLQDKVAGVAEGLAALGQKCAEREREAGRREAAAAQQVKSVGDDVLGLSTRLTERERVLSGNVQDVSDQLSHYQVQVERIVKGHRSLSDGYTDLRQATGNQTQDIQALRSAIQRTATEISAVGDALGNVQRVVGQMQTQQELLFNQDDLVDAAVTSPAFSAALSRVVSEAVAQVKEEFLEREAGYLARIRSLELGSQASQAMTHTQGEVPARTPFLQEIQAVTTPHAHTASLRPIPQEVHLEEVEMERFSPVAANLPGDSEDEPQLIAEEPEVEVEPEEAYPEDLDEESSGSGASEDYEEGVHPREAEVYASPASPQEAVAFDAMVDEVLDEVEREEREIEAKRVEDERLEAERLEAERVEAERLEAERVEAE